MYCRTNAGNGDELPLPFLCQSDQPCIATRRNRGFCPRNAPPERGIFFRPQAYDRVRISLAEVSERAKNTVISVCKKAKMG